MSRPRFGGERDRRAESLRCSARSRTRRSPPRRDDHPMPGAADAAAGSGASIVDAPEIAADQQLSRTAAAATRSSITPRAGNPFDMIRGAFGLAQAIMAPSAAPPRFEPSRRRPCRTAAAVEPSTIVFHCRKLSQRSAQRAETEPQFCRRTRRCVCRRIDLSRTLHPARTFRAAAGEARPVEVMSTPFVRSRGPRSFRQTAPVASGSTLASLPSRTASESAFEPGAERRETRGDFKRFGDSVDRDDAHR